MRHQIPWMSWKIPWDIRKRRTAVNHCGKQQLENINYFRYSWSLITQQDDVLGSANQIELSIGEDVMGQKHGHKKVEKICGAGTG